MDFATIVQKRYATKQFDGKKIPEENVNQLLEMIRFAPSSFNIQPWKVVVISDQTVKEKLQPFSWNQPQITSCSHLLVFCADTDIENIIQRLEKQLVDEGAKKESIQRYLDMIRNFTKGLTPEQNVAWVQKQVYIALGNALNGAKALGFDSCPMEGFDQKGYTDTLHLPETLIPTVLCPIGYGSDQPTPKMRFAREDVFMRI
ncbi:NAD(P)H-dependent oxidoreductase [Candidatus Woesearchaeota archaeon]|nr:NAD(P)H-dependent oxidoreductase [Candidatus Woesearchaeota archaeon]